MNPMQILQEGGGWAYAVALCAPVTLGAGLVHAIAAKPLTRVLWLGLLALPLALAWHGREEARGHVDAAVALLTVHAPAQAEPVRAQGYREADRNLQVATVVVALGLLPGLVGEVRRRRERQLAHRRGLE